MQPSPSEPYESVSFCIASSGSVSSRLKKLSPRLSRDDHHHQVGEQGERERGRKVWKFRVERICGQGICICCVVCNYVFQEAP